MAETIRERISGLANRNNVNVGKVERWASVLGGVALAAYALKRRSRGGLGLAALGAPLLLRGATGHCAVYQKMGIDRGQQASQTPQTGVFEQGGLEQRSFGQNSFEQDSVKPLAQSQSTEVGGVTSDPASLEAGF
jgi:Protein of unknown function (DUF2892)